MIRGLKDGLMGPWGVFGLAFCVRLVMVLLGYDGDPQDTPEYDEIAHNLLSGRGFVASEAWHGFELRSWRAPFYPFFLAGVYGLFGHSHLVVRVIQCGVGALTAVLVMKLGQKLDPKSAPICGGLAVVYGPLAAVSNEVMTETWFAFFLVLGVYWLIPPMGMGTLLGAGFALGMAGLTRPVGLVLAGALVLAALVRRSVWGWRCVLVVLATAFLVVLPWTVRNYAVHGVWPMLSSQGGFIAARSNALDPDWRKAVGWGMTAEWMAEMPSEVERDRFWWGQALAFVQTHPVAYLKRVGERFLHFWYFFTPAYNFWYMLVLPFFLFGFYRFWASGSYVLPALTVVLSLAVFCCVLYANSRFRLPLEPFFLIFAGPAVGQVHRHWGLRRTLGLVAGLVIVHGTIAWQAAILRDALLDVLALWGLK